MNLETEAKVAIAQAAAAARRSLEHSILVAMARHRQSPWPMTRGHAVDDDLHAR